MKKKYLIVTSAVLLVCIFLTAVIGIVVMGKRNAENPAVGSRPEEPDWQIEEDDEPAAGSNLSCGSSVVMGEDSLFTLNTGRYGGEPADNNKKYYIYQKKEGDWRVFAAFPDYGSSIHKYEIDHLLYWDGYLYCRFKHSYPLAWNNTLVEDSEIWRFSVEGEAGDYDSSRGPEGIASCDANYYLYRGALYFRYREKGKRGFYRASADGKEWEELYADRQEDTSDFDYTVGGGCLYLKDEDRILGIDLDTGEQKRFATASKQIDGLFYERGMLYIDDAADGRVCQMDVRTGAETELTDGGILYGCVWIHDGFLYYIQGWEERGGFCCGLKAIDLATKETALWELLPFDRKPCDAGLEVSEGRVLADFCVKGEDGTEKYTYLEKTVGEITGAAHKGNIGTQAKENGQRKTIVVRHNSRSDEEYTAQEDGTELGEKLWHTFSAEGNGCLYSTDEGICDGEVPETENSGPHIYSYHGNIYRQKDGEGEWELFAANPASAEDWWDTEISVYNLICYGGYLYYILVNDYDPYSGAGQIYIICRIPEQGGAIEKMAFCKGNFYIDQGKIYYDNYQYGMKQYCRMNSDGSGQELLYFDNNEDYRQFSYLVRDGHLTIKEGDRALEINVENGDRTWYD